MSWIGLVLACLVGVAVGLFGGGGSILMVPLLVYGFGLGAKEAIASSLLVVGAASLTGAIQHARRGQLALRAALTFSASGGVGAYAGGRLGALFDGGLLLLLFAGMMMLTSIAMWRGRRAAPPNGVPAHASARLLAQGLAVGLFTGLVGAGGGFLIVPTLSLWAGLPLRSAIGTSLFIIVLQSTAGFLGHHAHVTVDANLIVAVAAAAIVGSLIGADLAQRFAPATARRAFAGFVGAMSLFVLTREAELWFATAGQALPSSAPQAFFALLVLGVGLAAGRASQRAGGAPFSSQGDDYEQGAGI